MSGVYQTILTVRAGSHAYGTNLPTSDLDIRGVAVVNRDLRDGFRCTFEQAIWSEPHDTVIYEIRKFFRLASESNPNILELLWADEMDVVDARRSGLALLDGKRLFLSRKAGGTFRGYAVSQLKRIRTHRRWLLDPPKAPPTRAEHGLPERTLIPADHLAEANAAIRKKVDSWELDLSGLDDARRIGITEQVTSVIAELGVLQEDRWLRAGQAIGLGDDLLQVMGRERAYKAAQDNWSRYQAWKEGRNPVRAAMEAEFGFDGKNAMHLVRLLRMCREILERGEVIVHRPDADELLAIRRGEWAYDKLEAWADEQNRELLELVKTSPLPEHPDYVALDALCVRVTHMADEGR